MKRLWLAVAMLTAGCGQHHPSTATSASAGAPARMEALAHPSTRPGAEICTADGVWCGVKNDSANSVIFSAHGGDIATFRFDSGEHGVWPQIIRAPRADGGEDVLVGVSDTVEQSYSGGGGQATQVSLYQLSSSAPARTTPQSVLTFPSAAEIDIRACFSPADVRARRDACSDQYNFSGALSLDPATTPDKIVLVTEATTYPGHLSRSEDNTRPLTADDLKTVRDETCSYRRVFSWNAATGAYAPNAPLPACGDYLQP